MDSCMRCARLASSVIRPPIISRDCVHTHTHTRNSYAKAIDSSSRRGELETKLFGFPSKLHSRGEKNVRIFTRSDTTERDAFSESKKKKKEEEFYLAWCFHLRTIDMDERKQWWIDVNKAGWERMYIFMNNYLANKASFLITRDIWN